MAENNKHNILYFEGQSMKQLYINMDEWQKDNGKRFLSTSVNKDGDNYCCIALTNPSEVFITNDKLDVNIAGMDSGLRLDVDIISNYADWQPLVGVNTTDDVYITSGSYSTFPVEVTNTVEVSGSVSVD